MFCKKCGKELDDKALFCPNCGEQMREEVKEEKSNYSNDLKDVISPEGESSSKSRLIAAILCYFLGCFGAHDFYVGKKGKGIALLIMTITFIPLIIAAIIAFVNFIQILCGVYQDAEGKTLKKW